MQDLYKIPSSPGCYLFRDSAKKIIYIGKARDLKKRVSSYFQKKDHDPKTGQLVKNIDSVEFITTDNESEALILENTLIKKHRPKYNIDLKDSKRYAFLRITDEEYPRLLTARDRKAKGKYFGPFVSGSERKDIQETLTRIFRIRTCRKFPTRPCLRHHINLCDAPCVNLISKEDYNSGIGKAEMALKGHTKELSELLHEEMKKYSSEKKFEKALSARNQIQALEGLSEKQKMERDRRYNEDIMNYFVKDNKVYLMLFNIYKGTLANKSEFVFDKIDGFFEEFIVQYYDEHEIPKEIILPESISPAVHEFLEKKKNSKITITVPKIGEKKQLLELVSKNIELTYFGDIGKAEALKKSLHLNFDPEVIECFDVSHLSGTLTVGSMVYFRNGKPDKNNYRRFKIVSYMGNDDFSGIAELVMRRYKRLVEEKKEMPSLIMIDGGLGQLNAALSSLQKLNLQIPIISLAKKLEEIYVPGNDMPVRLDMKDRGLLYLRQIRDEAHRFAINYNKLLRKKEIKS